MDKISVRMNKLSVFEATLANEPARAAVCDLPEAVQRELRSDHAGELGAVWIYQGVLAVTRNQSLRTFAQAHRAAEQAHLDFFLQELPKAWHSRLAPLWRIAGFLLGALPAFFGPRAVYRTIAAVEAFVDEHYQVQIDMLEGCEPHEWLRDRLIEFRADELHHRDDALDCLDERSGAGLWGWIVHNGSVAGAMLARRF